MIRVIMGLGILAHVGLAEGQAADYFLDPHKGSLSNEGTKDAPWPGLQEVMASGKTFAEGDTLTLLSGFHGQPTVRGMNGGWVRLQAGVGESPTVKGLTFRDARYWNVSGVAVSPSYFSPYERATLVYVRNESSKIVLENCSLFSEEDTSQWSVEDWNNRACNGIDARGAECVFRSNRLHNVNFGISITGVSNLVEANLVENFSGDGLRGLGDYGVFENNTVKNCYDVNGNHDDGFQSWSVGSSGVGSGVVKGVVLRGNRIINYEDPNQPYRGTLQGIGCFDGFFEDWVIENNEILVDHWHGITLGGARNCRIVNNTVVDLNEVNPGPPWIRISSHKSGEASSGNIIRNNLSTAFAFDTDVGVADHNLKIADYGSHFVDYDRRNLRLVPSSPALDAGSSAQAPAQDHNGVARPLDGDGDGDSEWDIGAHEYVSPQVDTDGDGQLDSAEIISGHSPVDALDFFRVTMIASNHSPARLQWLGVPQRAYQVEVADRPVGDPWLALESDIGGDSRDSENLLCYEVDHPADTERFFRVGVRRLE